MKTVRHGGLEQEVMDILWNQKHATVRVVLSEFGKTRKLAYTTVATILQRLYDKRLVKRKQGRQGFEYAAKFSKKSYSKNVMKSFLRGFMDSFGDSAIASFADSIDKLPYKKRKYFLQLLKRYDQTK